MYVDWNACIYNNMQWCCLSSTKCKIWLNEIYTSRNPYTQSQNSTNIYAIWIVVYGCWDWPHDAYARCMWWKWGHAKFPKYVRNIMRIRQSAKSKNIFCEFKRDTIVRATCVSVSTKHMRRGKRENEMFIWLSKTSEWVNKKIRIKTFCWVRNE